MADWSALPRDILEEISGRSDHDADYVRFRSVCTSWRSAAPKRPQFPWLFIRYVDGPGSDHTSVALLNLPKFERFRPRLPEEIYHGRYICGSSHGWIALLDRAPAISLHNPLTGNHIQLPVLLDLPERVNGERVKKIENDYFEFYKPDGRCQPYRNHFSGFSTYFYQPYRAHFDALRTYLVGKVVLSSDPVIASGDCQVMARCYDGHRLIHCRLGDTSWTALTPIFPELVFHDIIFAKGRFYTVSNYRVFVCDTGPDAKIVEILPADPLFPNGKPNSPQFLDQKYYLVVSSGDLLLVALAYDGIGGVFLVDLDGGQLRLLKLQSLGGRSLFLGRHSMSISAGNFTTCEKDCWWTRLFNMEGGSVFSTDCYNWDDSTPEEDWESHCLTPNLCC